MKLINGDCLEEMKSMPDNSIDILCTDVPYALGSEVIIKANGKPDYKKAVDFMNKWEMPSGDFWEQWFKEAYRILKHGSHCLVFGMDRQLLLFKYYACMGGFSESQSLYWYFISNFPKATDLGKMLDKQAGVEREVIGEKTAGMGSGKTFGMLQSDGFNSNKEMNSGIVSITAPASELAKKYDGYKYSVAPLKQTCETIMVFRKPYKTGSCLHDVLAYEAGDKTITVGAVDIDGNRVATSEVIKGTSMPDLKDGKKETSWCGKNAKRMDYEQNQEGRYPSQTYVDDGTAEVLDKQSGVSKSTGGDGYKNSMFAGGEKTGGHGLGDTGGCSKILHKIKYDTADLFMYEPKVSSGERNEGCEDLEKGRVATLQGADSDKELDDVSERFRTNPSGNIHPTVKPIDLMVKILKLFKTPDKQVVLDCFMGSGSTGIACKQQDLDFIGIEINKEYFDIATARINNTVVQNDLF